MSFTIVGIQSIFNSQSTQTDILSFHKVFFDRLHEIEEYNKTRIIRYESLDDHNKFVFIGLEVTLKSKVPEGMVAWTLAEKSLIISENKSERLCHLQWDWQTTLPGKVSDFPIGDFSLCDNSLFSIHKFKHFLLTAHAFTDITKTVTDNDKVQLVKYDKTWDSQFFQFTYWLRSHLQMFSEVTIEHYGSTAIPEMPAKPIIDVLMEIPSFKSAPYLLGKLCNDNSEYWWYDDHMAFIIRDKFMGKRCFHLHVAPRTHRIWEGVLFRDYLKEHPDTALKYAHLKQKLAKQFTNDRENYTISKTDFITSILSVIKKPNTQK